MKEYDYYSVDEIMLALESNQDRVLDRCIAIAITFVNKYKLAVQPDDIFQEALTRIMENDRNVPKSVNLATSIGQIIRSISYDNLKAKKEEIIRTAEEIDENTIDSDNYIYASTNFDNVLWDKLLTFFIGDELAVAFLKATENGMKKNQIIEKVFNKDSKAYDTTRRRIIRSGNKLNIEENCDVK